MDIQQILDVLPAAIGIPAAILWSTYQLRQSEQKAIIRASHANTQQDEAITKFAQKFDKDKDALQEKYEALLASSSRKDGELSVLEKQIANSEIERKEMQKGLMKLTSDFELMKSEREKDKAQIEVLITERDNARTERDTARAERDEANAKVIRLEAQVTQQAETMSRLHTTLEKTQATIKEQSITIESLTTRITELETKAA